MGIDHGRALVRQHEKLTWFVWLRWYSNQRNGPAHPLQRQPETVARGGGAGELHHFRERQRPTLLAGDLPGRGGLPARLGGVHELIDRPIPEGPCTNISLS